MPALNITNSNNIASLDFKETSDLCEGVFIIDLSPTIWISGGASNVLGASVKVTNPYGVVIKYPPTSGYDIYPPMTSAIEVDIPTQASNYQYGNYTVEVYLTDSNGTIYTLSKPVNICAPNPRNKNVNHGSLSATLDGNCVTGKVAVIADTVPTYKGAISDSQVNEFTLKYPTVSERAPEVVTLPIFNAQLFEGEYRFEGTICAHYSLGDNIFANVNYRVKRYKTIRCLLDKSCVAARLAELQNQISQDCTDKEKIATQNTIINALLLLTVIDGLTNDGQDPSDYISQLESVLGCVCTCNCADGTPIIPTVITDDFVIQGCNVTLVEAGVTKTYTINNYAYIVEVTDNGNAITITSPTLEDCTQTQTITFNIDVVYDQIKAQIVNTTEYNFWASIINKTWDDLSLTCLDSPASWSTWTFAQRSQWIISSLCAGGRCEAIIASNTTSVSGVDVVVDWQSVSGVYSVEIYLDDILVGAVIQPTSIFTIEGAADGNSHDYTLISRCSNGSVGTVLVGTFNYFGCPAIAAPTVTDTNVEDATCPYDLTALVNTLPLGVTAEWHTINSTHPASLVANPASATTGIYHVFAKDSNGCYSLGTQVILTCSTETACTAPQNLLVEAITDGFRVRFQSSTYPPPSNSYTVKRRLKSSPDVSGSYTTIGTPTWNATENRWQILDETAIDNTLYVYRAISNCASSAPYIDYSFANITCPTVTLTPSSTSMGYSFTDVGGSVNKYEVRIYDAASVTLIHTDTVLPAFSNPITGTFVYLTGGTTYNVRVRVFIDTYYMDCSFTVGTTIPSDTISNPAYMNLSSPSMSGTIDVTTVGGRTLRFANFSTCGVANAQIIISGGIGTINNNITSAATNASQNVDTLIPVGSYTFTGTLTSGCTSAASIYFI